MPGMLMLAACSRMSLEKREARARSACVCACVSGSSDGDGDGVGSALLIRSLVRPARLPLSHTNNLSSEFSIQLTGMLWRVQCYLMDPFSTTP